MRHTDELLHSMIPPLVAEKLKRNEPVQETFDEVTSEYPGRKGSSGSFSRFIFYDYVTSLVQTFRVAYTLLPYHKIKKERS